MIPVLGFWDGFLIGIALGLLLVDFCGREVAALFGKVERWITPRGSR